MTIKYNVIVQKEEKWYVAKCLDNNVASQGKTIEEALNNLKEALELFTQSEQFEKPKQMIITTLEVAVWVLNIRYCHPKKIIKILKRFGFEKVSQKGSHVKYRNSYTGKIFIIPMHSEIASGTLKSILEQANIELDQFLKSL